jgi:hypothetical protein
MDTNSPQTKTTPAPYLIKGTDQTRDEYLFELFKRVQGLKDSVRQCRHQLGSTRGYLSADDAQGIGVQRPLKDRVHRGPRHASFSANYFRFGQYEIARACFRTEICQLQSALDELHRYLTNGGFKSHSDNPVAKTNYVQSTRFLFETQKYVRDCLIYFGELPSFPDALEASLQYWAAARTILYLSLNDQDQHAADAIVSSTLTQPTYSLIDNASNSPLAKQIATVYRDLEDLFKEAENALSSFEKFMNQNWYGWNTWGSQLSSIAATQVNSFTFEAHRTRLIEAYRKLFLTIDSINRFMDEKIANRSNIRETGNDLIILQTNIICLYQLFTKAILQLRKCRPFVIDLMPTEEDKDKARQGMVSSHSERLDAVFQLAYAAANAYKPGNPCILSQKQWVEADDRNRQVMIACIKADSSLPEYFRMFLAQWLKSLISLVDPARYASDFTDNPEALIKASHEWLTRAGWDVITRVEHTGDGTCVIAQSTKTPNSNKSENDFENFMRSSTS